MSVGTVSLSLTYDSSRHVISKAMNLKSAAELNDLPSFGPLWISSLHRRLNIRATGAAIEAYRGDGTFVGFGKRAAGSLFFDPVTNSKDSITAITGGYLYYDDAAGVLESYNANGQLTTLADKGGSTITFAYSTAAGAVAPAAGYLLSVTDNTGRSLSFTYTLPVGGLATADGVVSTITSSDGRVISVGYDTNKNLTTLTWQDNNARAFLYENSTLPWALTGKVDENGVRIATWAYDANGFAISSDGALGTNHFSSVNSTPPQITQTDTTVVGKALNNPDATYRKIAWSAPAGLRVTLANGQTADASVASVAGQNLLTGLTQPAGSGCTASSSASTFDAKGNLLSEDDFQGNRTCYAYDSTIKSRVITRVEGLANTVACSTVLPANATLPSGARRYTTTWDPDWKAPVQLVQPGSVTTLVYNGRPDPKNGNATANCSPAAALPNGAPLNLLCKQVIEKASGAAFDNPLGSASDANIDKVVLLLHGEDGDGSPVVADSSSYLQTPTTRYASSRVTYAQSKFGSGSMDFATNPTTQAYAYGPSNLLAITGDFTIEMFVKLNPFSSAHSLFGWGGNAQGSGAGKVYIEANGTLNAYWPYNGYQSQTITGPVVSTGVWHHVALSRLNGTWIMHLDGVQAGATMVNTENVTLSPGRFAIGAENALYAGYFNGYVDEVRITKGMARYWGTFTPPTAAFPDPIDLNPIASKTADANYAKDILLIHADDVDGSKSLVDSSSRAAIGTISRNAKISTTQSKYGGSSLYVPGSTDYGDVGTVLGDFTLPGDFTVEYWMKPSSTTANTIAVRIGNGGVGNDDFYFGSDRTVMAHQDGTYCMFGTGLAGLANSWIHVAYVRIAGTIYSYINGAANGSCAWAGSIGNSSGMRIGYNGTSNAVYYDDIRITKGLGRYTAAFIPPAYPFSNVAALTPDASTIVNQYTYDAQGRKLTAKDSKNATTTYAYYTATAFTGVDPNAVGHTLGDLYTITDPKGFVTTFNSYDKAGRILQMTDPKGIVTTMTYTPRSWISTVSVTPPGGTARVTTYTYDFVGQVTSVSNPDGTTIGYTYDAAHRLIGATDAKGNSVNYTLDNMGNRIAEQLKDPGGVLQRTMSRSFDALNRVQQLQLQ